jgi:hypothetical protein
MGIANGSATMNRLVLAVVLLAGCALGDDDGGSARPIDGPSEGGLADSRGGPIIDSSSGLPDSRPYPDAPPPVDARPVVDAAPCGTPGPDTCEAATDLSTTAATASGATVTGDTTLLASDLTPTDCTGFSNPGPDAIYKLTAAVGQTIHVTLTSSSWDASVYITSACSSTACVAGADESVSLPEETSYAVTAAGTYFVAVDGYTSSAFGCYSLNVKLE